MVGLAYGIYKEKNEDESKTKKKVNNGPQKTI
jgi:hypothetical protein